MKDHDRPSIVWRDWFIDIYENNVRIFKKRENPELDDVVFLDEKYPLADPDYLDKVLGHIDNPNGVIKSEY